MATAAVTRKAVRPGRSCCFHVEVGERPNGPRCRSLGLFVEMLETGAWRFALSSGQHHSCRAGEHTMDSRPCADGLVNRLRRGCAFGRRATLFLESAHRPPAAAVYTSGDSTPWARNVMTANIRRRPAHMACRCARARPCVAPRAARCLLACSLIDPAAASADVCVSLSLSGALLGRSKPPPILLGALLFGGRRCAGQQQRLARTPHPN